MDNSMCMQVAHTVNILQSSYANACKAHLVTQSTLRKVYHASETVLGCHTDDNGISQVGLKPS